MGIDPLAGEGYPAVIRVMKLELIQESQPYHQVSAIAFNMADSFEHIRNGNPVDVCYSIVENYYRGNSTLQLRIKDIHEREDII